MLIIYTAISVSVYQVNAMAVLNSLETVANLQAIPKERLMLLAPEYQTLQYLPIGQVGTILEVYGEQSPQYLVEFADLDGRQLQLGIGDRGRTTRFVGFVVHVELSRFSDHDFSPPVSRQCDRSPFLKKCPSDINHHADILLQYSVPLTYSPRGIQERVRASVKGFGKFIPKFSNAAQRL
jgi:hypothetical protein